VSDADTDGEQVTAGKTPLGANDMSHALPRGSVKAPPRRVTFSWCFYDFANTIYSMNVVTMYFAQWIVIDNAREDIWYGTAYAVSMAAAALSVPVLGAISDSRGRRTPYLFWFTLLCIAFTALIGPIGGIDQGTLRVLLALSAFAVANYGFHASMVFYNALLPDVSTPATIGRVSGLGVALGYAGAIAGLIIVAPFVEGRLPLLNTTLPFIRPAGRIGAFVPTAIAFLIFSIPTFLFLRDTDPMSGRRVGTRLTARARGRRANGCGAVRRPGETEAVGRPPVSWVGATREVLHTLRNARQHPGLFRFLIANYLYEDAINTIIVFMAIYAQKVMGLPDTTKVAFFITGTTAAIVGSYIFGFVTDRMGAKRTLTIVLIVWIVALAAVSLTTNVLLFWVLGAIMGVSMGATWTSARPLLAQLSPPEMLGEVFGLYALSGKAAAILGPLVWGGIVLLAGPLGVIKYRVAAASLILFVLAGLLVLRKVPDPRATGSS
jgi:UMF1 family MFS transporter